MRYLILTNIAILANKSSTGRDILGRLQLAYENLLKWLQQGVINWNKGNIELENKSTIVAACIFKIVFEVVLIILYFLMSLHSLKLILQKCFLVQVYPTISSGTKN